MSRNQIVFASFGIFGIGLVLGLVIPEAKEQQKEVKEEAVISKPQPAMIFTIAEDGTVSGIRRFEGVVKNPLKLDQATLDSIFGLARKAVDGRITGTYEEKASPKVSPVVDNGTEELEWVPIPQKKPEPKPAVTHAPDPKPEPKTYSTHPKQLKKARRMFVPQTYLLWHPNYPPPNQPNRFPGRYFKY